MLMVFYRASDSDQPLPEDPAGPSCSRTLEDEDGQHTRSSSGSLSASLGKRVVPDEPDTIAGSSPPSSYKPWFAPATGSDECLRRDTCNHPNDLLRSIDRYTGKSTKRRTANSPPRRDTKRSVGIAPFVRPQSDVVRVCQLRDARTVVRRLNGPLPLARGNCSIRTFHPYAPSSTRCKVRVSHHLPTALLRT